MPLVLAAAGRGGDAGPEPRRGAPQRSSSCRAPDTRNVTRAWMVAPRAGGGEGGGRAGRLRQLGQRHRPLAARGRRAARAGSCGTRTSTDVDANGDLLPPGEHRYVAIDQYERTLRPELLDEYVNGGYCWVVIGSLQAGRSFAQPKIAPAAIAYYAALSNQARLMYHVSPFATGNRAVPFSFDWSIDYYPSQYARPGPELSVYRLTSGKCAPNYAAKQPDDKHRRYRSPPPGPRDRDRGAGPRPGQPQPARRGGDRRRRRASSARAITGSSARPTPRSRRSAAAGDHDLGRRHPVRLAGALLPPRPHPALHRRDPRGRDPPRGGRLRRPLRARLRPRAGHPARRRASRSCSPTASSPTAPACSTSRFASTRAPAGRGCCSSRR